MKRFFICTIILTFTTLQASAQIPGLNLPGVSNTGGSEFFVGRIEGKPLVKVHLLSGVHLPGVYHVPIQTNLAQLLSFAGGATDNALLDEVTIRSSKGDVAQTKEVDLESIMKKNEAFPVLSENDTVYIKTKSDSLARTALIVGILAGIASIVLTTDTIVRNR